MKILYVIVMETHKGPPYIFHITAQQQNLNSFLLYQKNNYPIMLFENCAKKRLRKLIDN